MNAYTLEDKKMDEVFLRGDVIHCKAAMPMSELSKRRLLENQKIVVILSTGKKYMATVKRFQYQQNENLIEGTLDIIRA